MSEDYHRRDFSSLFATVGVQVLYVLAVLIGFCRSQASLAAFPPFQPSVDAAEAGSVLIPKPGTYAGPVVVEKPITIDGQGQVTIDNGGKGTLVWYSRNNLIARNDARGGRYSLHFMYSQHNRVEGNHYEDNTVGILLMYSDGVEVRNNTIANASGATGIGIGFKETSDVTIDGNRVLYCATGLYLDVSPYQPETMNRFTDDLIAYNGVGVRWLNDWHGNIFIRNRFKGNITQIAVEGGKSANDKPLWAADSDIAGLVGNAVPSTKAVVDDTEVDGAPSVPAGGFDAYEALRRSLETE